jgi:hypothetical protein
MSIDTSNNGRYNTLPLTAVVRSLSGAPLAGTTAVIFTSSDSSLRVSSTGVLTARQAHSNVKVVATAVVQGIRVSDTATVNITAAMNPPVFQSLRLRLMPGDTVTTVSAPGGLSFVYGSPAKRLQVGALDATNTQIPGSLVAFQTSDILQAKAPIPTTAATVSISVASNARIGVPFTVYASATVYGVTLQDSLQLTVGNLRGVIYTLAKLDSTANTLANTFTILPRPEQTIGVGGYVWWVNSSTVDSLDVVFDDPTGASPDELFLDSGGGNIAPFVGKPDVNNDDFTGIVSRQFLQAGTFHWHSPQTGVSGTVVVQ